MGLELQLRILLNLLQKLHKIFRCSMEGIYCACGDNATKRRGAVVQFKRRANETYIARRKERKNIYECINE